MSKPFKYVRAKTLASVLKAYPQAFLSLSFIYENPCRPMVKVNIKRKKNM